MSFVRPFPLKIIKKLIERNHTNKTSITAALLLILFALLTIVQRLNNSMGYFSAAEIAWFSIAVIAVPACTWLFFNYLIRDRLIAVLLSIVFSYLFFNGHHLYLIFESKINTYEYFATELYSKILALLLLVIASLVIFTLAYKSLARFRRVTVEFFGFYLVLSLLVESYLAFNHRSMDQDETSYPHEKPAATRPGAPNIYYIILDSFTSLTSLQKFWNYADPALETFLNQQHINYSGSAHTKFATTPQCMASYLNMYWEQPVAEKEEIRDLYRSLQHLRYNAVLSVLRQHHYQVKNLSLFKLGKEENFFTYFPEVSIWGNSMPFLVFRMNRKLRHSNSELENNFSIAREVISQSRNNAGNQAPVFTYAHLMLPHSRYLVDSAGFLQKNKLLPEKQRYLGQLQFARKTLVYLFTSIMKNDPGSVIIIQGDHGYRGLDDPRQRKTEALTMFNSLYLSGEKLPADTLSCLKNPVNTFGIVFNRYFGTEIEMASL